jgi:hypothetical protein
MSGLSLDVQNVSVTGTKASAASGDRGRSTVTTGRRPEDRSGTGREPDGQTIRTAYGSTSILVRGRAPIHGCPGGLDSRSESAVWSVSRWRYILPMGYPVDPSASARER